MTESLGDGFRLSRKNGSEEERNDRRPKETAHGRPVKSWKESVRRAATVQLGAQDATGYQQRNPEIKLRPWINEKS
jgi:hypothetical protein